MSVRPTIFHDNGRIDVWHDERGHGGTVRLADIHHPARLTGADDTRYLMVACPVTGCDSVSVHPVGGGADPERVQALHALKRAEQDRRRPFGAVLAEIAAEAEAMDGPGRFRLRDVDRQHIEDGTAASPVETRDRDRRGDGRERDGAT